MTLKDRIEITERIIESFDSTDMESDEVAHFQNDLAIMQALERIRYVGPICSNCEDKGETTTPHCISCGNLQEQP